MNTRERERAELENALEKIRDHGGGVVYLSPGEANRLAECLELEVDEKGWRGRVKDELPGSVVVHMFDGHPFLKGDVLRLVRESKSVLHADDPDAGREYSRPPPGHDERGGWCDPDDSEGG